MPTQTAEHSLRQCAWEQIRDQIRGDFRRAALRSVERGACKDAGCRHPKRVWQICTLQGIHRTLTVSLSIGHVNCKVLKMADNKLKINGQPGFKSKPAWSLNTVGSKLLFRRLRSMGNLHTSRATAKREKPN